MSRGRGLRWLSRGVVLAWCVAGLGLWVGPAPHAPVSVAARVRPVAAALPARPPPEPAAEPAPTRHSKPRPEPPTAPAPRSVGAAELAEGGALLDGAGRFPGLSFGYEAFSSFSAYARAMVRLGARFVAVRNREIVGGIDLETRAVHASFQASLQTPGFSPRARDYTGEAGLAPLARAAREHFGARTVVMMLVPRQLDAGLFGGIAGVLAERGEVPASVREVRGRYERAPGGGVLLRLDSAVRGDGSALALDAVFDLGLLAGGAHT